MSNSCTSAVGYAHPFGALRRNPAKEQVTLPVSIAAYQPGTPLDTELAGLGYAAICGWPDQRPVTTALARSQLRPFADSPPTLMFLARTAGGVLVAAAALRYPSGPGAPARLWGPVVTPNRQEHGLGTALLEQVNACLLDRETVLLTAGIPATRQHGCAFFERAGWRLHSTAALLHTLIVPAPVVDRADVRVLDTADAAALGRLYHAVHPTHELVVAAGTYRRWSADERFITDGLVGVANPDGELQAAALIYPLIHVSSQEPAEALLAEVLVHPSADRAALARPLIMAVLAAGARHDARVARAVVPTVERALLADLHAAGLTTAEEVRSYQAPLALPSTKE
ncbi:serine/threonine-protein phosphatase [Streptosporangium sp. NBC_01495]|uniref:hypothetical protein n=1 Tax=Streptosporangium sp. NBC_01495 TaxID=2903899 RepID=UPI002E31304B|nr:hypothetical protein [Streptosporangium sp. NBC_01495]